MTVLLVKVVPREIPRPVASHSQNVVSSTPHMCGIRTHNINGHNKKDKRKNNDLQNITKKTKHRARRTLLKNGVKSNIPEGKAVPDPHVVPSTNLVFSEICDIVITFPV